jgi:hypothetical protein
MKSVILSKLEFGALQVQGKMVDNFLPTFFYINITGYIYGAKVMAL